LQRKPDISLARKELAWAPTTTLPDGLKKTIEYFDNLLRSVSLQNQQTR
jgi:UDP-glucuronate decarboxylase